MEPFQQAKKWSASLRGGQEKPDSGEIETGSTVKVAYVDQSRDKLEGNHNVFQEVSGGADILNINGIEIQSRAYIGRFNFKGQDQQKMVGSLSQNLAAPGGVANGSVTSASA